jgi:threonine-phosphate decarboxylase
VEITHGGDIFAAAERIGIPWPQVLDFSASINPLGPSPAAREAILAAIDRIVHYPSRSGERLCRRLAAEWSIPEWSILAGNGATDLLFKWCRHFSSGSIGTPAFGEFHRAWPNASLFPLDDHAQWPSSGAVVLTRPANPTGLLLAANSVLSYAGSRRDPVLVDESFLEFTGAESLIPHARGNLFVLRSMTKFWALPGLRVAALVGDVAPIAERRSPWSLNILAEEAALASLDDREHAQRTRNFIRSESTWLANEFGQLRGYLLSPASANYFFLQTEASSEATAFAARRQILIRDCRYWPGLAATGVRVAVRCRWENELLLNVLRDFTCT